MSNYFKEFPNIEYRFGDEGFGVEFQHLGTYIDIIDEVKEYVTYYQDYHIIEYERPDAVSSKLYGTPNYSWTFYLLNDHIRSKGWPVSTPRIYELAPIYYPDMIVTTDGLDLLVGGENQAIPFWQSNEIVVGKYLFDPFAVSQGIVGKVYKILRIDYDYGYIWLQPSPTDKNPSLPKGDSLQVVYVESGVSDLDPIMENAWLNNDGEVYTPIDGKIADREEIRIHKKYNQLDAPFKWYDTTNNNEQVWPKLVNPNSDSANDINGLPPEYSYQSISPEDLEYIKVLDQYRFVDTPNYQSLSYRGRLELLNDEQRSIKVISPNYIAEISSEFRRLLRERL
jgi:hypothetical protein